MKKHESLWYGIIAWAIVLIGTFFGLVAWWAAETSLLGYYLLWSLVIAVPTGLAAWLGVHYYQRHRWLILPCILATHVLMWLLIVTTNGRTLEQTSVTFVLYIPLVYSLPAAAVAWVVTIIGAERLRRKQKNQLPNSATVQSNTQP